MSAQWRDETSFLLGLALDRLEGRGEILPGARSRLEADAARDARTPAEAIGRLFDVLDSPGGQRYLSRPSEQALPEGVDRARYVIGLLPVRQGKREDVVRECALAWNGLRAGQIAEDLAERLEDHRDWHADPRPLPVNVRRAQSLIEKCRPFMRPNADVGALAAQIAPALTALGDHDAVQLVSARLESRGCAVDTIDRYEVLRSVEAEKQTSDTASDADTARLREIYSQMGGVIC